MEWKREGRGKGGNKRQSASHAPKTQDEKKQVDGSARHWDVVSEAVVDSFSEF